MSEIDKKRLSIVWIEIAGLRGFSEPQRINLGNPNGTPGSGLTIIVGPNNSGKSTIIEAFSALSKNKVSIAQEKRNKLCDEKISIKYMDCEGKENGIATMPHGVSETSWINGTEKSKDIEIFVLQSKKTFRPFFNKDFFNRDFYIENIGYAATRQAEIEGFYGRLFSLVQDERKLMRFNELLSKVLIPLPAWELDQSISGQYFLKFKYTNVSHSSEGVGEGIISIFMTVDALCDSEKGSIIVIDEPELSLHPSVQKRLLSLFAQLAEDRQIILATHSPKFINWDYIFNGAKLVRSNRESSAIRVYEISDASMAKIKDLHDDKDNPHLFGYESVETFFLEDNVILVEGQEDVVYFPKILDQLKVECGAELFGWGTAGAGNMGKISALLRDLGFKKVLGFLDKGEEAECAHLRTEFPGYQYLVSPAEDIRTKKEARAKEGRRGIFDENLKIREEYKEKIIELTREMKSFFESSQSTSDCS
jgi:AAA15 family ATPase/GTPase